MYRGTRIWFSWLSISSYYTPIYDSRWWFWSTRWNWRLKSILGLTYIVVICLFRSKYLWWKFSWRKFSFKTWSTIFIIHGKFRSEYKWFTIFYYSCSYTMVKRSTINFSLFLFSFDLKKICYYLLGLMANMLFSGVFFKVKIL